MKRPVAAALVAGGILAASVSTANAAVYNTTDSGWYSETGRHGPSNTNIYAGSSNEGFHHNFVTFDLTGAAGLTATSATLYYISVNGYYSSLNDASETFETFDYTSGISALVGGTAGVAGYTDLGSGISYGATTVNKVISNGPMQMPQVVLNLNAAAIASINSTLSGTEYDFAIGGKCTTCVLFGQALWSASGQVNTVAQLEIQFGPAPVPLPAALPLFGAALSLLGFFGWRRKRMADNFNR